MRAGNVSCCAGRAQMLGIFLLVVAATACVLGQSNDTGSIAIVNGTCPPGYYMGSPREESACHPCPEGSYKAGFNDRLECSTHKRCIDVEVNIFEGNSTANAVCLCQPGWQRVYPTWGWSLYTCSPCPNGTVQMLVPDSPYPKPGDTICCKPEEIPAVRLLLRTCKLPDHAPPTDLYHGSGDLKEYILPGALTAITIVCVFVVIIIYYCRQHPEFCSRKIKPCSRARANRTNVAYNAADIQEIPL